MAPTSGTGKTALVTGANGYIGNAVARAFQQAGYTTYGLVRSAKSAVELEKGSIVPIIGSAIDPNGVVTRLQSHTTSLSVIVSTTEDTTNYVPHFTDTVVLLRVLAEFSSKVGVRPLVLFSSGSKDYGRDGLDGAPDLLMQTEETPIRPPAFLADRATHSRKVLDEHTFDAALLRPTHVHGYTSSYLGQFFDMANNAKRDSLPLRLETNPRVILHTLHVDDCAEAYVALADHADRGQVAGQIFNISAGKRYETMRDIANALVKLYSIDGGASFVPPDAASLDSANPLIAFSQWVGSEKLRDLTGWTNRRTMFVEGLAQYRDEYEQAVREEAENIARVKSRAKVIIQGTSQEK